MLRFLILLGVLYAGDCVAPPASALYYFDDGTGVSLAKIDVVDDKLAPSFKPIGGPWDFKIAGQFELTDLKVIFTPKCSANVSITANTFVVTITKTGKSVKIATNEQKTASVDCAPEENFRLQFELVGKPGKYLSFVEHIRPIKVDMSPDKVKVVVPPTHTETVVSEEEDVAETTTPPATTAALVKKASPVVAIVVCIIVGLLCLAAGGAAGFFGRGFYDKKKQKTAPPPVPAPAGLSTEQSLGVPPPSSEPPSTATADLKAKLEVRKPTEATKEATLDASKKEVKEVRFSSEATKRPNNKTKAETMSEKISRKDKNPSKVSKKEKPGDEKPLLKGTKE
uniref:Uncharacterized protein n=1 Tax=Panagrellus redivivus TaxID=6233 RepID=A0A7E4UXA2_PANRE